MAAPTLYVDKNGVIRAVDASGTALLQAAAGHYRAYQAGSLLVLALDEGTGSAAREGETLALAGDIRTVPLLSLMNLLGQNRETGRLVIKRGTTERVILLHNGDVASIGSNLPADRLGTFLVRLGKLSETQLDDANKEAERTGKRIGQVLLGRNLLDAHQLWSALQEQITELFTDAVNWSEGSFTLFRLPADQVFPSTPPLTMQGLLLEAVRRADEMSVYRERISGAATLLRRIGKPPGAELAEDVARALQACTPQASVAEVARGLHVTEFDATRLCYELLRGGLVEIVRELPRVQTGTPAFVLRPEDLHAIEVFNLAFREIHDEIVRAGARDRFLHGVQKYLADEALAFHGLFRGVNPDEQGALPPQSLARNLTGLVMQGHGPMTLVMEALNELTCFMLFQSGELLDAVSDEMLARRVRLIHAALGR